MSDAYSPPRNSASEFRSASATTSSFAASAWTSWLILLEESALASKGVQQINGVADFREQLRILLKLRSESRQLLVDVSEVARIDHGGGIQRVTHRLMGELLFAPPQGYRVEPVRVTDEGCYVYARQFLSSHLGLPADSLGEDEPVQFSACDHFLGLDLIRDRAEIARPAILAMRRAGVNISFVVYDLLPYTHPQWFPKDIDTRFNQWLHLVAETADLTLCISESVCFELRRVLREMAPGARCPAIASFALGADFSGWSTAPRLLDPLPAGVARFLIVGTIERRKGHRAAIDAFEALWADGIEVQLVLAGKPGWLVGPLLERLRKLRDQGALLHWFDAVDDHTLVALYRESTALLAPSEGEGYGLPLAEAAWNGLPIIARDIPVFREVAGNGADYFSGAGDALTQTLRAWLDRWSRGGLPSNTTQVSLWAESALALGAAIEKQRAHQ